MQFDLIEFIDKNPEDWLLVCHLFRAYAKHCKGDLRALSLRSIASQMGVSHMFIKRRIERLNVTLNVTPSVTVGVTEQMIINICSSISYQFSKSSFVTPVVTPSVTVGVTSKRKEPKENNISLVVDNKLSPTRVYDNKERENNASEKKVKSKFGSNKSALEYNVAVIKSLEDLTEDTPYKAYVLWMIEECGDLLDIMKLPLEKNFLKMLGYFGYDIIKETMRDMTNNIAYLTKKKYKEIGQTAFNWAKRNHDVIKPMTVKNPNDENEIKYCNWVNKNYPNINALKVPFTYEDYCYLISKFDKNEVTKEIIYLSSRGFDGVTNLRDRIEFFFLNKDAK